MTSARSTTSPPAASHPLPITAAAGPLRQAVAQVFTGGINNRHDLCRPRAAGWSEVAARADGFYLQPQGWCDARAGMGCEEHAARAQLLDSFAQRRFLVEDDFGALWRSHQRGDRAYALRHITGLPGQRLGVLALRPDFRCVGYCVRVGVDEMLAGQPEVIARRFAEATRAVRVLGIPVYWLWTPVCRPELCLRLRQPIAAGERQRWEHLALEGLADGVAFDIPPAHLLQNGGPGKDAIDWYLEEMIPRCRARRRKSLWLCNTIHSPGHVFAEAVERVLAADAMADTLVPTASGRHDYPATPETTGGDANLASTTGAALWAIRRLQARAGDPAAPHPAVRSAWNGRFVPPAVLPSAGPEPVAAVAR
jgi:hypothetical protein